MDYSKLDLNKKDENGLWTEEIPSRRLLTPVSSTIMREFGIERQNLKIVNTLKDLREAPPNIIIATGARDFKFIQNYYREQSIKKDVHYVMNFGIFQQLHLDKTSGKRLLTAAPMKFKNVYKPYMGQELEDGSELLVFRTGGIGDLLFIQPNLRYLKQKYPKCYIKFACGPQYQPMVRLWEDCIDEIVTLPFTFDTLRNADYHLLFEGVIERCKEAETTNAYRLFTKWLGLNLPDELLIPKQTPNPKSVESCKKILDEWRGWQLHKDFVVLQLRASSPIRTPSPDFWRKIIDQLTKRDLRIVFVDNPKQAENIDKFMATLSSSTRVFNFARYSESIGDTIALTSLSKGVIATDSALLHIAASLDLPCYGIYGPFPGEIRLDTYPKAKWINAKRFCAPCFIHSPKPCKYAEKNGYSPCYGNLIDKGSDVENLADDIKKHIRSYDKGYVEDKVLERKDYYYLGKDTKVETETP
jgi:ADP-heptose:LPS heptosyltransferase